MSAAGVGVGLPEIGVGVRGREILEARAQIAHVGRARGSSRASGGSRGSGQTACPYPETAPRHPRRSRRPCAAAPPTRPRTRRPAPVDRRAGSTASARMSRGSARRRRRRELLGLGRWVGVRNGPGGLIVGEAHRLFFRRPMAGRRGGGARRRRARARRPRAGRHGGNGARRGSNPPRPSRRPARRRRSRQRTMNPACSRNTSPMALTSPVNRSRPRRTAAAL